MMGDKAQGAMGRNAKGAHAWVHERCSMSGLGLVQRSVRRADRH